MTAKNDGVLTTSSISLATSRVLFTASHVIPPLFLHGSRSSFTKLKYEGQVPIVGREGGEGEGGGLGEGGDGGEGISSTVGSVPSLSTLLSADPSLSFSPPLLSPSLSFSPEPFTPELRAAVSPSPCGCSPLCCLDEFEPSAGCEIGTTSTLGAHRGHTASKQHGGPPHRERQRAQGRQHCSVPTVQRRSALMQCTVHVSQ